MTLQALELNDHAITLGAESGVCVASPGFALAREQGLVLGEAAQSQSRLHPNESHNRFWQDLSLDELPGIHGGKIRHLADFAYAQLLAIAEEAKLPSGETLDVLVNVPGSFSRQQLGILLGIAKPTPFNIVGLVDSAIASAAALYAAEPVAQGKPVIVLQQQLHQTLLSLVTVRQAQLRVESVVSLPSTGSQHVMDSLMQLSTELFIEQCRFNPQHDAATEQLLYNALPSWLQSEPESGSLILELAADGTMHNAKLPYESLVSALAPTRHRIAEQVIALLKAAPNARLVVCSTLGELPGLRSTLSSTAECSVVDSAASIAASLAHSEQLLSKGGIALKKELPLSPTTNSQNKQARNTKLSVSHLETIAAPLVDRIRVNGNRISEIKPEQRDALELTKGDKMELELGDGRVAIFSLERVDHGEE